MSKEAMQQALDALVLASSYCDTYDAIDALREALASPQPDSTRCLSNIRPAEGLLARAPLGRRARAGRAKRSRTPLGAVQRVWMCSDQAFIRRLPR